MDIARVDVKEGSEAPDFQLTSRDGVPINLSDFKGKRNLVIYFYPRDFTPGCTIEASEFTRDYNLFLEKNIEIVGISPDNDISHNKFRQSINIPYLLVSDEDHRISKIYGAWGLKKFMGKESMGITRSTFLIDINGKIFKVFKKVKSEGHSREILDCFN